MNLRIGNISSFQFFQLARYSTFILIGIVLAKVGFSTAEIGQYETLLFISGAISFFWLNGLIQGLLTSYSAKNNLVNPFFNVFVVLSALSCLAIVVLILFERYFSLFMLNGSPIPLLGYLCAYVFFSVPAGLVEHVYLLRNQSKHIVAYAVVSFSGMLLLVVVPALMGLSVKYAVVGLVISAIIRYLWLIVLLLTSGSCRFSTDFFREHIRLSIPLIVASLLSGSAQYIDGFIVSSHFDEAAFAVFRYGAREFPLALLLANAFSSAMIPRFSQEEHYSEVFQQIKRYSTRLIHLLFPLSLALLAVSHWLFPLIFNHTFTESATIFNIYILLVVSRLVFPQTILIGMKQTRVISVASLFEIIVNVVLSLWFVQLWGLPGIAYATVLAYLFEKVYLSLVLRTKYKVDLRQYLNVSLLVIYSVLLVAVFYLVEFVIY